MSISRLKEYLDNYRIRYISISHSVAYTAGGIAALTHIPGREVAKTVIVKLDGTLAMAVVPSSRHVDLTLLREATGARMAALATEEEFQGRFPDCETGAMPPFGNLYGMTVYVDEELERDKEIVFNAGSHRELVRMAWVDFERLVQPRIVEIAAHRLLAEVA